MSKPVYGASPTKSKRRTKADIERLKLAIYNVVWELQPMTVRQVFYQLVSRGAISKTEAEYKSTVCRLLVDMRRNGELPYHWIADNTRWMRKQDSYSSLGEMLEAQQHYYRRAVWGNQDAYVEIWLEKDALSGVLYNVTNEWDVPLMVTRGYPSVSFIHEAALAIQNQGKPAYLYYFGDRDPSGVDIDRFVEKQIREITPEVELHFTRVAVLPEQIDEYDLPTRPTKKTDSRSKSFDGESVEVDAIAPDVLRQLCEDCITQHLDREAYDQLKRVEDAELQTLAAVIENLEGEL